MDSRSNQFTYKLIMQKEVWMLKLGSHVGMSGKELFFGSAKEAASYGSNTFMIYTGAPQNTRRKSTDLLKIEVGLGYMKEHGIEEVVIHAPYIINLGNSVNADIFSLATEFLAKELERTAAFQSKYIVLHPGSHVGAGAIEGIKQVIKGLNEVLTKDSPVYIALETMAGKGSEIGRDFEELARIYDGVVNSDKLRVCFDTCHVHDSGYDIINDFDGVIENFERFLPKEQIAVFHINDSKNECGAAKDRHENIGFGKIGFEALNYIVNHKDFMDIPKILETPYILKEEGSKISYPPYKYEINMFKEQKFDEEMLEKIREDNQ